MTTKIRSGVNAPVPQSKTRRAPSRAMTWEKLKMLIQDGYGQGHLQAYKPWLHITRRTTSPVSNIGLLPAPDLGRTHHYLSAAERTTILLLKWLGAHDIREQYPAWPWAHSHPLDGLDHGVNLARLPGLLNTAKTCGIDHGNFFGTAIPYIATLDVLSTWKSIDGSYRLLAHECKPESALASEKGSRRTIERLELTGQYCIEANITRQIVHAEHVPQAFAVNLDALFPRLARNDSNTIRLSSDYQKIVEALEKHRLERTPTEVLSHIAQQQDISQLTARTMMHLAIWHQDVDHDLSKPLELNQPLILGGKSLRKIWHEIMLGGRS